MRTNSNVEYTKIQATHSHGSDPQTRKSHEISGTCTHFQHLGTLFWFIVSWKNVYKRNTTVLLVSLDSTNALKVEGYTTSLCTSHLNPTPPRAWREYSLSVSKKASEVPGHRSKNTEWSPRPLVFSCTNQSPLCRISCDSLSYILSPDLEEHF